MIIQRYVLSLCMVLGLQINMHGAQAAQRSESAPTVPTQMPAEVTPRAVSDSAVSKKIEYQQLKATIAILWGIHDHDFLEHGHINQINYEKGYDLLPEGYKQPIDIFADMQETQKDVIQSPSVALPEPLLPRFHASRPNKDDTTYFVKAKPDESSPTKKRVEVGLASFRERLANYRIKKVPSPSSRFPAEVFHQTGEIEKDFSPVEVSPEDDFIFSWRDDIQGVDDE